MTSQKVSNIGRIVDTLVLGGVVIVTGLFRQGELLRWLICVIFTISMLEIANTIIERCYQRREFPNEGLANCEQPLLRWPHRGVWMIWAELAVLQIAIISVFLSRATGRELILVVGTTVSIDAGGLFIGKWLKKLGISKPVHALKNLSPNKTYAGYLGELIFGFIAGATIVYVFGLHKDLPVIVFILVAHPREWVAICSHLAPKDN